MRTKLLLSLILCCLFSSNILTAQKAKFKSSKAVCQKTRLPQNYIAPENRTYDLYKKGAYADQVETYNRGIFGWKLDSENPKMEAVISIYGFQINPVKRNSKKREKKNKEGKVTDRWTEYSYQGSARGRGTLYIYGESNEFSYQKKKLGGKSKAEKKKEEAEEAKKKALESNPFLSSEDVANAEDAGESDISEDTGLDAAMLPLVQKTILDVTKNVKTGTHRSSSSAYKQYTDIEKPKLYEFRNNYPEMTYQKAMNELNQAYGYSPVNYNIWLKTMKTEKHPEFQMWNDACQAVTTLFSTFKYNKSIKAHQAKFEPIIAYFKQQLESITDKDKKAKKMKRAAFSNLTNILYYLDRCEEAIAICEKYQDSKIVDRLARRMYEKAARQTELMKFHHLDSCHLEEMADVEGAVFETSEDEDFDEEGRR